jgi:hypothetical protein
MENSENPTPPEEKALDDSLKLAIREEIEREVEKRIQRQEGFYWKFLALFGGFVAVFAYALWHVQVSELPGVVQKELATQAVTQAKDRIMEIKASAEAVNQNLNVVSATVSNVLASVNVNQQTFTNRLNEIKQQDNVVLMGDLSKLFVIQTVTNLTDWNKIILDYEPIPHTLTFTFNKAQHPIDLNFYGHIEGRAFVLNSNQVSSLSYLATNDLKLEYIRKSLR